MYDHLDPDFISDTYKSSCAEYFYSGDTKSGAKLVDLDGAGPFEPMYMNCDFRSVLGVRGQRSY